MQRRPRRKRARKKGRGNRRQELRWRTPARLPRVISSGAGECASLGEPQRIIGRILTYKPWGQPPYEEILASLRGCNRICPRPRLAHSRKLAEARGQVRSWGLTASNARRRR